MIDYEQNNIKFEFSSFYKCFFVFLEIEDEDMANSNSDDDIMPSKKRLKYTRNDSFIFINILNNKLK